MPGYQTFRFPRFGLPRSLGRGLGQESYLQAAWAIATNPLTAAQVLGGNPQYSAIGPETEGGLFSQNAAGYVTQSQKQALINQEAANLVTASGGTMSQQDAVIQAESDVTAVLKQAGADPSQSPFQPTPPGSAPWYVYLLVAAGVGLIVYQSVT